MTETDATLLVANNDERRETEAPTALHHLGNAVDMHETIHELVVALLTRLAVAARSTTALAFFISHDCFPSLARSATRTARWDIPPA